MREVLWKVGDAWCRLFCSAEAAEQRGVNGCRGMMIGLALDAVLVSLVVGVLLWLS